MANLDIDPSKQETMLTERMIQLMKLLENDPHDSFVLFAIAKEYESLNLLDQAEQYYLTIKKHDASYVGMYYHLAKLYEELGNTEQALSIYEDGVFMANKMGDQHALAELKNAKVNLEMLL